MEVLCGQNPNRTLISAFFCLFEKSVQQILPTAIFYPSSFRWKALISLVATPFDICNLVFSFSNKGCFGTRFLSKMWLNLADSHHEFIVFCKSSMLCRFLCSLQPFYHFGRSSRCLLWSRLPTRHPMHSQQRSRRNKMSECSCAMLRVFQYHQ